MTKHREKYMLRSQDKDGDEFEVIIEGKTYVPFWRTDLNMTIALALLESVDLSKIRETDLSLDKQSELIKMLDDMKDLIEHIQN